ncbi:uncharacterized protein MONOS_17583 [Monocercomonoides exilis]|uniref:uncharacterized protein n=1 Tax=Monocercomonoides exilis TaxID=2049356 RepID=UPI00355AC085|nr:hypothetical protein MONOS_17583 [Monocercomonoides exilis]
MCRLFGCGFFVPVENEWKDFVAESRVVVREEETRKHEGTWNRIKWSDSYAKGVTSSGLKERQVPQKATETYKMMKEGMRERADRHTFEDEGTASPSCTADGIPTPDALKQPSGVKENPKLEGVT